MIRATLSEGSQLNASFYAATRYSPTIVARALDVVLASGLRPTVAWLYNARPEAASPRDLYDGIPSLEKRDFLKKEERDEIGNFVLASCDFVTQKFPLDCEARLRSKFHEDGTFGISLDFPYSGIFEEADLDSSDLARVSDVIETLGVAIFETSPYLYGGVAVEWEAPSLKDLEEGRAVLPTDFGLFSGLVIDLVGREELSFRLKPAKRSRELAGGGLYFKWSELWEDSPDSPSAIEFQDFIRSRSPRVSTLRPSG